MRRGIASPSDAARRIRRVESAPQAGPSHLTPKVEMRPAPSRSAIASCPVVWIYPTGIARSDLKTMMQSMLSGKMGLVFGVANKRSIAWAIAQAWHREGARLAFTYQGERLKDNVEELAGTFGADTLILECDVTRDDHITRVFSEVGSKLGKLHLLLHSVAFAPKEALEGEFVNTSREAYRVAHDVSAYSLVALSRAAVPLMTDGGSILAMTYYGSEKVVPHYNVMGVAKASL